MGEILSDYTSCVDSTSTLLWKHVKFLSDDEILIFLPCTKTKKYNGEFVDVFATKDKFCCPVSSLKSLMQKHIDLNIFSLDQPVFSFGKCYFLTTRKLNEILKDLLMPWYNPQMDLISGHSFRGAVANIMQENSQTFSKSDCQYFGRWASSAYTVYLRQHRAERKLLFNKLSNVLR
jgi:hypothetical protein